MEDAPARARRRHGPMSLALLLLLGGAWLRWRALSLEQRLTPDEAFFSTFARAAAVKGDWWLNGPLDKPPLALYANALSQVVLGPSELAARTPNALAGILLLPLIYALTRDLYRHHSNSLPLVALLLTACSPFLVASSANALTDGLTLTALAAAFWLALRHRPGWSGLLSGLALAAKHQALLALPLLLWAACRCAPSPWPVFRRFGLTLTPCIVLLLLWDAARPGIGVHTLAISNNDPGGLATIADLPGRLAIWTAHAAQLFWPGWPGTLLLLIAALPVLRATSEVTPRSRRRQDLALALFAGACGLLHIVPAIPLYGRYLLPVTPALFPLCARGLHICLTVIQTSLDLRGRALRLALVPVLAAPLLLQPLREPDPHAGIDGLGAWLAAKPVATVVYDRWLGWQLGYYLGVWHDKRLTWYPEPEALARDAVQLCEFGPRYFPAPSDQDMTPWLRPLQEAGFAVSLAWQLDGYVAWQLDPPWQQKSECPQANQGPPD
ncbi:MAG: glycosyltransferase family 39 protein [Anaerolineaceae bacterium]|nr:glycosyltransferase family 39 protein [Anaerolineaceae bacterium]